MELIINKEAYNSCQMRCKSSTDCCCDCIKKCAGHLVCPIFNYTPKERKERMTREKMYKNMFDAQMRFLNILKKDMNKISDIKRRIKKLEQLAGFNYCTSCKSLSENATEADWVNAWNIDNSIIKGMINDMSLYLGEL